jgi:hypothetical protein
MKIQLAGETIRWLPDVATFAGSSELGCRQHLWFFSMIMSDADHPVARGLPSSRIVPRLKDLIA